MRMDDHWADDIRAQLPEGDYLIASLDRTYTYDDCKPFDFIVSATTGTDHIDNRDIPLLCLRGAPVLDDVHATSEHVFALMLSLIRHIPAAFDDVKRGNWNREAWQGTELRGKTLGIVGYGRVGQQVAQIAHYGFGMKLVYCDTKCKVVSCVPDELMSVGYEGTFDHVLKHSDIVTVHVPLTDETRGMFSHEQFKQMKPSAYFINTSRGAVVDEKALMAALFEKEITGAALDVVVGEPDSICPHLRDCAEHNGILIITPHLGGQTAESRRKTQVYMAGRIIEHLRECRG